MSKGRQRLRDKLFGVLNWSCVADEPATIPATTREDIPRPISVEYRRRTSSLLSLSAFFQDDSRRALYTDTGKVLERQAKKQSRPQSRRRPGSVPLVQSKDRASRASRASPVKSRRASIGDGVHSATCGRTICPTKQQVRQATLDALNGNIAKAPQWSYEEAPTGLERARPSERRQPVLGDRLRSGRRKRESTATEGRGRSLTRKADVDNLRESARRHREESEFEQRRTSESRHTRTRNQRIRKSSLSKPLPPTPILSSNIPAPPIRTESSSEAIHRLGGWFTKTLEQEGVDLSESAVRSNILWGLTQPATETLPRWPQHREAGDKQSSDLIQALQDDGLLDLNNSEETRSAVLWSPAVTHQTNIVKPIEVVQPAVCREIHNHHFLPRVLPIVDMQVLPARHFIPAEDGGYLEITEDEIPGGKPKNLHQVIADALLEHNPRRQIEKFQPFSTDGTNEEVKVSGPWPATRSPINSKHLGMRSVTTETLNTSLAQHGDELSVMSRPTHSGSEVVEKQNGPKASQPPEFESAAPMVHTILPIRLEYANTEAESTSRQKSIPTAHAQ